MGAVPQLSHGTEELPLPLFAALFKKPFNTGITASDVRSDAAFFMSKLFFLRISSKGAYSSLPVAFNKKSPIYFKISIHAPFLRKSKVV